MPNPWDIVPRDVFLVYLDTMATNKINPMELSVIAPNIFTAERILCIMENFRVLKARYTASSNEESGETSGN